MSKLKRTWKTGDTVELTIPKTVRLEPTPDNKSVAAIMWGPLVLAGDHGRAARAAPRSAAARADSRARRGRASRLPIGWCPTGSRAGDFRANQVARDSRTDIGGRRTSPLAPFYRTQRRTYSVYFDVLTQAEFDARAAAITAEREHQRRVEAATISYIQPGDAQPEQEYNYQSDPADRRVERTNGRSSRGGQGWFSFDLPVDPQEDMAVRRDVLQRASASAGDGELRDPGRAARASARFAPNSTATGFYDAQYAIPAELTRGKARVTVKFAGVGPGRIAPVFGVRLIKAF